MLNQKNFRQSTILRSIQLLSKRDRRILGGVAVFQMFFSILDLIGIALIGVIGSLTIRGVQSISPSSRIMGLLEFLHIENMEFQKQIAILGFFAASVLIIRTLTSIYTTRKILLFLSRRSAVISTKLFSLLLNQPITFVQERTSQQTLFVLTEGVRAITVGVIANLIALSTDIFLLTIIFFGLLVFDPIIAICTLSIFVIIGLLLYRQLQVRAHRLGIEYSKAAIYGNEKILEALGTFRDTIVKNRHSYYTNQIGQNRMEIAENSAEMAFMPNISKYVIESTLVLGAFIISAVQFLTKDSAQAIGTLSIFLAAGSRIAPALLRIQQEALSIRNSSGTADPALQLIEELGHLNPTVEEIQDLDLIHLGFNSNVLVKEIVYTYPKAGTITVKNISLEIGQGQYVAIVGPSGAGKTTLVDLILGVLSPESGRIEISGLSPIEAIKKWPGSIAYVPQDVEIINGSVAENVALGYPRETWDMNQIIKCLEKARLGDVISNLENGVHSSVGESGNQLSGGQRQRLGIARSLYTNPKLLIMDEATSNLDAESEAEITEAILGLKGKTTVIVIAHRLSTIRNADLVVYLENGESVAQGNFSEVRAAVPNFDKQSKLMGL
jgi:ABC-type multidrug transport system fused ATPase/permease subunit